MTRMRVYSRWLLDDADCLELAGENKVGAGGQEAEEELGAFVAGSLRASTKK